MWRRRDRQTAGKCFIDLYVLVLKNRQNSCTKIAT